MKSENDIVTRLRVLNHHAKKLAENESLHALHRDAFTRCEELTWKSAEEIMQLRQQVEELRAERDEARKRVCEISLKIGTVFRRLGDNIVEVTTPEEYAEIKGWDCFKETP